MSGRPPSQALRVLHVYSGNLFGGVERFAVTLAREREFAPDMISEFALCFEGRLREELVSAGAAVHRLPEVRVSRPWTVWAARRALSELLDREKFDVVATHSGWLHAIFALAVRKNRRSRLVRWLHESPGRGWVDRRANKVQPDLWIANSLHTLAHSPANNGAVVYLPVAPTESEMAFDHERMRRDLNCPPDHTVVLCFSRLERWKGHRELLAALAGVGSGAKWVCWVAGGVQRTADEDYLAELRATASQLGIQERVKFLGDRRDVAALIAAADVHCQPNTGPEPFGIAFIEAMYGGLAVVTTAIGGAMEIIEDGVSGVLVPSGDPAKLADALRRVIGDGGLRRRLGENARRRAAELCNPARQMKKIEETIVRVLQH